MTDGALKRGCVVRYSYLWSREYRSGHAEGLKDRPTVVLSIAIHMDNDRARVLVVPVTHAEPQRTDDAVEMLLTVKRSLGLDNDRAWIVTTESNTFTWPGPDVRPIPGKEPSSFIYGQIPEGLLRTVLESFMRNRNRVAIVPRDDT